MSHTRLLLLGSVTLLFPLHEVSAATKKVLSAHAAAKVAQPRSVQSKTAETVSVHAGIGSSTGVTNTTPGGGLMAVQTVPKVQSGVTRDYIAKQSPTANPLTLIQNLPGVVSSGVDPFGASDQMGLSIRGMDQSEIGFTFEGMPAADPISYVPLSSTVADTENIGHINVAQGAPDLSAPLYNAVGGQITEGLRDPSHKRGGLLDLAYGTSSLRREFIRLETGDIGNSGVRGFLSFSYQTAHNWRGAGGMKRYHVDAKFVKDWENGSKSGLVVTFTRPTSTYLRPPTLSQWNAQGVNFNYADAYKFGDTSYYGLVLHQRNSVIATAPQDIKFRHGLSLHVTPFFSHYWGFGNGGTTLNESSTYLGNQYAGQLNLPYSQNGVATAATIDTYEQDTGGLNTYGEWKTQHNTLQFGDMYSYMNAVEGSGFQIADFNGNIASPTGKSPVYTAYGQKLEQWDIHFLQQVNALYVSDTYKAFNDRLTLNAGFKEAMVSRKVTQLIPGATYNTGDNKAEPLPQLSMSFKITPHDQVFFDAYTAFRDPSAILTYVDTFNTSTGKMNRSHSSNLAAEYSIGEELGYRHTGLVNISAALFNYNMTNRQISSTVFINGVATSASINAGGQTVRGAQFEASLRPWHHFSPYISGQYLHATMDNNFWNGTVMLPTAGKRSVKSPTFTGALGLSYDDGHFFGTYTMNYVGSQYSTFMNDEKVPSYFTANLSLGYRLPDLGFTKHPQIQINLINMGNGGYLSGVSGVTTNAKTATAIGGAKVAGSAPNYFVGSGFAGVLGFTTGF